MNVRSLIEHRLRAWTLAAAALACGLGAVACRTQPQSVSSARALRIEAEIAESEKSSAEWQPFTSAVLASDAFFCNAKFDCIGDDERRAYDPVVLRRQSDPALLQTHAAGPGPLEALVDFSRQLKARGIDFLVVVVPAKSAVYPEIMTRSPAPSARSRPDWELRRFFLELERQGIEVLDLYDAFVANRTREIVDDIGRPFTEKVYREQDIHWTSYGASLAAQTIAARVRQYPWFEQTAYELGHTITSETISWYRENGYDAGLARAIERTPALGKPPVERYAVHNVLAEGERITPHALSDPTSPVVVIGDSFANEYSRDGRRGGLAEHLLRTLGFAVDLIAMGHGSPYSARAALAVTRPGLVGKKLVVHEMHAVAPHYWDEWKLVDFGAAK